ncbi:hypothetical protein WMY93_008620 [Mugilogobius chulae]|uniref:AF4/FMR2 C-terminal homology domain-containing protein n=1 Tax=Mugilogobius chulae TaxID=88201 RepID=A0AAW0PQP3_9GOBI
MASQSGNMNREDRNVLRMKERERRNQEIQQGGGEAFPANSPLFPEPYKVNKPVGKEERLFGELEYVYCIRQDRRRERKREREEGEKEMRERREKERAATLVFIKETVHSKEDKLSSRIQSMLGNYDEMKEPIGADTLPKLSKSSNNNSNSSSSEDKSGSGLFASDQRGGTGTGSGQGKWTPVGSSGVVSSSQKRTGLQTGHSSQRGGTVVAAVAVVAAKDTARTRRNLSSSSRSSLSAEQHHSKDRYRPKSPRDREANWDSPSRVHTFPSGQHSSQAFPPSLMTKPGSMQQKPTAYVRPMDGQETTEAKSSQSETYSTAPSHSSTVGEMKSNGKTSLSKLKIPSQPMEVREMTQSWPPPLTAIHTPCKTEPSKFPFPTKDSHPFPSGHKRSSKSSSSHQPKACEDQPTPLEEDLKLSSSEDSDAEDNGKNASRNTSASNNSEVAEQLRDDSSSHSGSESSSGSDSESESSSSDSEANEQPRPVSPEPEHQGANKWQLENWLNKKQCSPASPVDNSNALTNRKNGRDNSSGRGYSSQEGSSKDSSAPTPSRESRVLQKGAEGGRGRQSLQLRAKVGQTVEKLLERNNPKNSEENESIPSSSQTPKYTESIRTPVCVFSPLEDKELLSPLSDPEERYPSRTSQQQVLLVKIDLSLLSRIPGRPYKEPADIKVERDECVERDTKDTSRHNSEKSSSKGKRKHKTEEDGTKPVSKRRKPDDKPPSHHKNNNEDSRRSLEKKEEPVRPVSVRTAADAQSRAPEPEKNCQPVLHVLSSGTGSGKEGSHSNKTSSASKHHKGEVKGRSTRESKDKSSKSSGGDNQLAVPPLSSDGSKNQRSKLVFEDRVHSADHYLQEAKKLKHNADALLDRAQEAKSPFPMYAETVELIKYTMKLKSYMAPDATSADKRLAVLW